MKREPGTPKASWLNKISRKPAAFLAIGTAAFTLAACGPTASADKSPTGTGTATSQGTETSPSTSTAPNTSPDTATTAETDTAPRQTIDGIDVTGLAPEVIEKLKGLTTEELKNSSPDAVKKAFTIDYQTFGNGESDVATKDVEQFIGPATAFALQLGRKLDEPSTKARDELFIPAWEGLTGHEPDATTTEAYMTIRAYEENVTGIKKSVNDAYRNNPEIFALNGIPENEVKTYVENAPDVTISTATQTTAAEGGNVLNGNIPTINVETTYTQPKDLSAYGGFTAIGNAMPNDPVLQPKKLTLKTTYNTFGRQNSLGDQLAPASTSTAVIAGDLASMRSAS